MESFNLSLNVKTELEGGTNKGGEDLYLVFEFTYNWLVNWEDINWTKALDQWFDLLPTEPPDYASYTHLWKEGETIRSGPTDHYGFKVELTKPELEQRLQERFEKTKVPVSYFRNPKTWKVKVDIFVDGNAD